ncbi:MAG: hypothetical protein ACM3IH_04765 [Sphingobacteriales bacterium]
MDEFLIGRNGVDPKIKYNDRAGPSFGSRAQGKVGTTCQFPARRGMAWRLREACVRAQPHDRVNPVGPRDCIDRYADDGVSLGVVACGH